MTRSAPILWPRRAGHMLRMIELQIETFFEFIGKGFQRRVSAARVCVADRAHRRVRRGELIQVTARAIFVAGKAGSRGIIVSVMTTLATSRGVTLTDVQELRIIEIVSLRRNGQGKRKK